MTKKGTKKRRSKGSMNKMRGGFKGMFKGSKGKKSDPKQFMKILAFLFLLFLVVFFFSQNT